MGVYVGVTLALTIIVLLNSFKIRRQLDRIERRLNREHVPDDGGI